MNFSSPYPCGKKSLHLCGNKPHPCGKEAPRQSLGFVTFPDSLKTLHSLLQRPEDKRTPALVQSVGESTFICSTGSMHFATKRSEGSMRGQDKTATSSSALCTFQPHRMAWSAAFNIVTRPAREIVIVPLTLVTLPTAVHWTPARMTLNVRVFDLIQRKLQQMRRRIGSLKLRTCSNNCPLELFYKQELLGDVNSITE